MISIFDSQVPRIRPKHHRPGHVSRRSHGLVIRGVCAKNAVGTRGPAQRYHSHTGGPRPSEITAGREKREDSIQRVVCQRFFRGGFGSHYIHVRQPDPTCEPEAPPPEASRVAQAIAEMEAIFTQQRQQPAVIQAGDIDEANP